LCQTSARHEESKAAGEELLYEARNAVQIARASGADQFAADTFAKAENSLQQAEAYQARQAGRKPVTMAAREAVQTAEDSRAIAVTRQEEARVARERWAGINREGSLRLKSKGISSTFSALALT
jgi:hypothetical protein